MRGEPEIRWALGELRKTLAGAAISLADVEKTWPLLYSIELLEWVLGCGENSVAAFFDGCKGLDVRRN